VLKLQREEERIKRKLELEKKAIEAYEEARQKAIQQR